MVYQWIEIPYTERRELEREYAKFYPYRVPRLVHLSKDGKIGRYEIEVEFLDAYPHWK